jgi:hypothetical protein
MARPSKYTPVLAERICTLIAEGRSLRSICAEAEFPAMNTVRVWLLNDPAFQAQYARARELQAEHYAEEIVEIADTEPDSNKARVRIDARKWTAVKLLPKKYGDKVQIDARLSLEQLVAGAGEAE